MIRELAWLSAAGAMGTLCRYGLSGLVHRLGGDHFPWGTWAVNMLGCFLFALVWTMAEERLVISDETRVIMLAGFMGAFTTFSTLAFETGELMRNAQWLLATANVLGQSVLGLVCIFFGFQVGRWL